MENEEKENRILQEYVPGGKGVRAWKKELRDAGVPDACVKLIEAFRAAVRDEDKKSKYSVYIQYELCSVNVSGKPVWNVRYLLTVGEEGRQLASVSHSFDVIESFDAHDELKGMLMDNIERCRGWAEAAASAPNEGVAHV